MNIYAYWGKTDSIPIHVIIFMSVYLSFYEKNHYNIKYINLGLIMMN